MTRTLRIFPQTNANVEWDALSLFDGMSCGAIALRELGIKPRRYYASEIDKHAIGQTQLNFPDTIQLGDVTKWREWDIDWANINLLMAGSPCQGFSMAGKRLAFDDPRSALFFVFIDILNHIRKFNPDVIFLLENVNMKKSHMKVINDYCGLHGVRINSSRVSAQMRDRWYWSNIRTRQDGLFGEIHTDIPQPEDREIFLRDILETEVDEKYYLSDKVMRRLLGCGKRVRYSDDKAACLTTAGDGNNSDMNIIIQRPRSKNKGGIHTEKSPTLSSNAWEQNHFVCGRITGRDPDNPTSRKSGVKTTQMIELRFDQKSGALTTVQKDNMVIQLNPGKESGGKQPYRQNRVYDPRGKSPALCAELSTGSHAVAVGDYRIRRLTPLECARLQTIPEWYIWANHKEGRKRWLREFAEEWHGPQYVGSSRKAGSEQIWTSETQQYRLLGNGWTIEVIKHILSFLPAKYLPKSKVK